MFYRSFVRKILFPCLFFLLNSTLSAKEELEDYYPYGVKPGVPEPLGNIKVYPKIHKEKGRYIYDYAIENGSLDDKELWRFIVDLSLQSNSAVLTMPEEPGDACKVWRNKAVKDRIAKSPIVPVVLYKPKGFHRDHNKLKVENWTCSIDSESNATWSAAWTEIFPKRQEDKYIVKNFRIKPGEKQSGFKIVSLGLPGMRRFTIQQPIDVSEDDLPNDLGGIGLYDYLEKIHNEVNFHGYTVGPVAPPANFETKNFIKDIKNIIIRAIKVGWIKDSNKAILDLDANLNKAINDIEKNNLDSAVNLLKELQVSAKKMYCSDLSNCSNPLLEEQKLFFILDANLDYLISRMVQ